MTIYTPSQNDKDKAKLIPEVVTEPLNGFKDDAEEAPQPRLVQVTFFRRNGRAFYIHLLLALAVLVILACGALGAVVFYRHLHSKVYSGKCGTVFIDTTYHNGLKSPMSEPMRRGEQPTAQMDHLEEDINVYEEESVEEFHTPAFDEVRETYVHHDFLHNFTAIVDREYRQCFIMKLNRTAIAPPKTVIEFVKLLHVMSRTYLQRASVIREDYEVAYVMEDLSSLGSRIARDCAPYPTHWLEKKISGVFKRSVEVAQERQEVMYALLSNYANSQVIYKINIRNYEKKIVMEEKEVAPAA